MKTWKRFLAAMICIVMLLSLVPSGIVRAEDIAENMLSSAAGGEDTEENDESEFTDGSEADDSEETDSDRISIEEEAAETESDAETESPAEAETAEESEDPVLPLTPVSEFEINEVSDTEEAEAEEDIHTGTVLAFSSDVHNKADNISANRLSAWIDMIIAMYGKIDFMGFCGDMADSEVTEEQFWSYAQAAMDVVASKGIPACYTTGNHEFSPGKYNTTANPVKNNYIVGGEGGRGDDYYIYCLGADNWNNSTDNYTAEQANALLSYLNSLGNDKLIIVLTHYPLHSHSGNVPGWNYGPRQTRNADLIIDALNNGATNGTADPSDDRTIVLLWGHNHTLSDARYDEVYAPGNEITYNTAGNSKSIQFYYAAAGCMSDSEYGTGSGNIKGKGLVITIENRQPVFAYYDAEGLNVLEGVIYPPEPVHVSGVSLDITEAEVEIGRTIRLKAAVTPEDADDPTVYFSSSDESIATVSSTGTVKGVSEGTAIITATAADGGYTALCTVTVVPRSSDITGYIITIGGYALSTVLSDDELVNISGTQRYLYHGLAGIPYTAGDAAGDDIVWLLTESENGNGYYIQSRDGRYLNATYLSNETGGKTGELKLDDTPDVWTLEGSLDTWMVSGSSLKSTNAGKSLTHEEESQDREINLFTVRTTGETSVLVDPETAMSGIKPEFRTHSVTLGGQIGVNFYMSLPETEGIDWHLSYMSFTVSGVTKNVAFNEDFKNSSGIYYGFTCRVNSIQMAETITAEFHYGSNEVISETYSVKQYMMQFDANRDRFDKYTVAVFEAMSDYGHYVQPFLSAENGWIIGEDYAEMDHYYMKGTYDIEAVKTAVDGYAISREINTKDIEKITYKLVFDSETAINIFFEPAAGYQGTFSAAINGVPVSSYRQSDGRYLVRVPHISAHLLGTVYNIQAVTDSGTTTVKVSAMSYVKSMLDAYSEKDAYLNAAASLYYYFYAASEYKTNNN